MDDLKTDIRKREAEEVGCFTLMEGMARNLYTHKAYYASQCTKDDGPFYCPGCKSDVVVRKCAEKKDHFAHSTRLTPAIGSNESELHRSCKEEICELLKEQYPSGKWATERIIPENKELGVSKLQPDISGRINNQRLAIEIQVSRLSITKIVKRAKSLRIPVKMNTDSGRT